LAQGAIEKQVIAKWRNLGGGDYLELDGVVECRDNRNGKTARIIIFK